MQKINLVGSTAELDQACPTLKSKFSTPTLYKLISVFNGKVHDTL